MNSRGSSVLLFVVTAMFIPVAAIAQENLTGITQVSVMAENPGDDGSACGYSAESMRLAADKVLLDSGIKVIPGSDATAEPILHINVTGVHTSALCAAYVRVSLRAFIRTTLPWGKRPARVSVILVDSGTVLTGSAPGFGERVIAEIKQYTEQICAKVRLANRA